MDSITVVRSTEKDLEGSGSGLICGIILSFARTVDENHKISMPRFEPDTSKARSRSSDVQ